MNKGFKQIEDIEAWKRGCRLAVNIYKLTTEDSFKKEWPLKDQLCRSAISIPSNLAEGFERDTDAEFRRFCNIAKGSCGELRTQLYIAQAIGLAQKEKIESFIAECKEISSMIYGLIKSTNKRINRE